MEQLVGDSADKHEKHMKELGAHASKVAGLKGEQALRDEKHASLEDRLEALEHKQQDTSNSCLMKLSTLEDSHMKMKSSQNGLVRDEGSGASERHALRDDNNRQMKEYWERDLKARQAYQQQIKDLLEAERSSRADLEKRVVTFERSLGLESSRLWVAIDKHTHDDKPPPQMVRQQSYVAQAPSTIVEVVDTLGHHHLETVSSRGNFAQTQPLRMSSTSLAPTQWSPGQPIAPIAPRSPPMASRALPVAARPGSFQSAPFQSGTLQRSPSQSGTLQRSPSHGLFS